MQLHDKTLYSYMQQPCIFTISSFINISSIDELS